MGSAARIGRIETANHSRNMRRAQGSAGGEPIGSGPIFWGELAPCEHIAQFYEHDGVLLDTLAGFIGGGLKSGEDTIVIATVEHLKALEERLDSSGVNVAMAKLLDRYIPVVAEQALDSFMVNRWQDDGLFEGFVRELIGRARANDHRVLAFGEMVALLWARGMQGRPCDWSFFGNTLPSTGILSVLRISESRIH